MTKEKIAILTALMEEITSELARFGVLIAERDATISQMGLSCLTKDERACVNSAENAANLAQEFLEMM